MDLNVINDRSQGNAEAVSKNSFMWQPVAASGDDKESLGRFQSRVGIAEELDELSSKIEQLFGQQGGLDSEHQLDAELDLAPKSEVNVEQCADQEVLSENGGISAGQERSAEASESMAPTDDPSCQQPHSWLFERHFSARTLCPCGELATRRIQQAIAEIENVAEDNPELAAEGAVLFLEMLAPALEQVNRSASTVGATIRAVEALSDTIAGAPVGEDVAHSWLRRLRRVSPPMCARLAS